LYKLLRYLRITKRNYNNTLVHCLESALRTAPPTFVKDRSARGVACARQFGPHWKEGSAEMEEKRREYAEKDRMWYDVQVEIAEREKEAKRYAKKQQKVSA
jgi:hypothetical protein